MLNLFDPWPDMFVRCECEEARIAGRCVKSVLLVYMLLSERSTLHKCSIMSKLSMNLEFVGGFANFLGRRIRPWDREAMGPNYTRG